VPQIELLTVANHAEAVNGLLYLSGAGWTDLFRPVHASGQVPVNHIGIGVAILVSWNETNQPHRITLRIENADGQVLVNVQGDLEMGRPPGLAPGSDLRGVMAINGEVQFPSAGIYRVVATAGQDVRSVTFRVHDAPRPASALPPQTGTTGRA
jgi:hypothetical protein